MKIFFQKADDCCKINLTTQQSDCLQKVNEEWIKFKESKNKDSFVKTSDMVYDKPSHLMRNTFRFILIFVSQCSSNCLFNNTNNIMTPDNKVNSDVVKPIVEKLLGGEWLPLLPSMLETCKERIDNCKSHGPNGPGKGPMADCNMAIEKLSFCLREQLVISCPDSSWKNSKVQLTHFY